MNASRSYDPYALFHASAERWPSNIALRIGEHEWTYAQLEEEAAAIAGWCGRNTPSGSRIAVHGLKGIAAYAGILGVLRSGRSYVPLHLEHPAARWHSVLDKSGSTACIADPTLKAELASKLALPILSEWSGEAPGAIVEGNEAYVMFTSGSTGGPKGVPVSRGNVAAYLEHMLTHYALGPEDRFSQLFALTFDLSVHDLFVCWGAGACLCVPTDDNALRMGNYIERNVISAWFSVPSLAALMGRMRLLGPGALPGIRHTFFCGEALPWSVANNWRTAAPQSRSVNLYGPTEATIAITAFELDGTRSNSSGTVPIGDPIGGNEARCVAEADQDEGELWVKGPQVTAGYLDRPEETAHAFQHLSGETGTWYRTGDRVRMDQLGVFHFLGRMDDQVKILGHRVEPGEVDAAVGGILVNGNSITLPTTIDGATRLVTFIDIGTDIAALMTQLRTVLPIYMLPERILTVDGFPYTAHGKVDRHALLLIAEHG